MPALLRRLLPLLAAALTLGTLAPAHGADRAAVERLLDETAMVLMVELEVDRLEATPVPGMPAALPDMLRARFDPNDVMEELTVALTAALDDADLEAFMAFRAGPLYGKLRTARVDHHDDVDTDGEADLQTLRASSPRRRNLIRRIDAAVRYSEVFLLRQRTTARALYSAIYGASDELRASPLDLDRKADGIVNQQRAELRQLVDADEAGALANISDDDIAIYVAFLESPETDAIYRANFTSLQGIMATRIALFDADVAAAAKRGDL